MITSKVGQQFTGRIPLSVEGIVGLWDDAWSATQRAIGYAAEALSRTEDIDSFLRAVEPQARIANLISSEVDEIQDYRFVLPPHKNNTVSRWHHDRFASQATTLMGTVGMAQEMPWMDSRWYKRLHRKYAVNPSLSNIVNVALEAQKVMLSFRDIIIEVDVDGDDTFFANRRTRQLATDIVTNLISNAVKYSRPGGVIRIAFYDNAFSIEDNGVGMDVLFARRLGQQTRIREKRAEGVDGFGFGWTTIGKALGELGWRYAIETEPNVGSKIIVTMNANHVHNHQLVTPTRIVHEANLFEILAQGHDILSGARPLADYHFIAGNFLDVSKSPAAWVIRAVSRIDAKYATPN